MSLIAIDLDNVLVENDAVEEISRRMGLSYTTEDVTVWGYECFPDEVRKAIYKLYEDKKYMCNLKPMNGTQNTLAFLQKSGHRLLCLTSRHPKIRGCTKKMVRRLFPEVEDTFFSVKLPFLIINKIDYFIDDNPTYCQEAANHKIKTILISNNRTPYNWNLKVDSESFLGYLKVMPSIEILMYADIENMGWPNG
jgi:5'(3')-deoxyribonucleotidase